MTILLSERKQEGEVPKSREVKRIALTVPSHRIFRESVFDTKNYYFYFTEVWKEKT